MDACRSRRFERTGYQMVALNYKKLGIWLITLFVLLPMSCINAAEIPIIDSHSQSDQHISFQEILTLMNEAGVSRTILALRGQRQPEELILFAARHPDRITPAVRTKGGAYMKGPRQFNRFLDKQIQRPQFGAMAEVLLWHAKKKKAPTVRFGFGKKGTPFQQGSPTDAVNYSTNLKR